MRASVLLAVVMIAFATASSVALLKDEVFRYVHRVPHILGVSDAAVASVRKIVPQGDTLGFISDGNSPGSAARRLYAVTYSLAPLIVEATASRRFIIGAFRDKASIPIALSQHRLRVVEDLGNGFWLLAAQ